MGCQHSTGAHAKSPRPLRDAPSPHTHQGGGARDLEGATSSTERREPAASSAASTRAKPDGSKGTNSTSSAKKEEEEEEAQPSRLSQVGNHLGSMMGSISAPFGFGNRNNSDAPGAADAMRPVLSQPLVWRIVTGDQGVGTDDTEWSYCLVFSRVAKDTDTVANPRQMLRQTFSEVVLRDWERQDRALWEKLDEAAKRTKSMNKAEFADIVYNKVLDLLAGSQCGFHLGIRPSLDQDEIFVLIKLTDHDTDTIDTLATHFRFYKSISDEVYHMKGVECPRTGKTWGQWLGFNKEPPARVPAYLPFDRSRKQDFQKLRDRLISESRSTVDSLVEKYDEALAKTSVLPRQSRAFIMTTLIDDIMQERRESSSPSNDQPTYASQQEALLRNVRTRFTQLRQLVSPNSRLDKLTSTFMKLTKLIDEQERAIKADTHGAVDDETEEERLERMLLKWSDVSMDQLKHSEFYDKFTDKDIIQLIHRRIHDMLDLDQAVSQGILVKHFPLHLPSETKEFNLSWSTSNPLSVFRYPGDQHIDKVREYFGEEVAFMFVFINFETRMLLFPSFGSLLYVVCQWFNIFVSEDSIFLSHKHSYEEVKVHYEKNWLWTALHSRIFEDAFALLMVVWVSYLSAHFSQLVNKKSLVWGVDGTTARGQKLSSFHVELRGSWWEGAWRVFHWFVVALFVWETVYFAAKMSEFRLWAIEEIERNTEQIERLSFFDVEIDLETAQLCGRYAVTVNIQLMTFIWKMITPILCSMENRATDLAVKNAQVYKNFIVSSIVYYYPFIYLAFFKEWVEKGACATEEQKTSKVLWKHRSNDKCIDELSSNLILNFAINIGMIFADLLYTIFQKRWGMYWESSKARQQGRQDKISDAEEQAKRPPYLSDTDDFLLITISLGFLAMFAVVEPTVAVVALATNLIQIRLLAWRMVNAYQRPVPREQAGIGAWHPVIKCMCFLSGAVCVALCVFALNPLRNTVPRKWKILDFVGAEHLMLMVVFMVLQAIPSKSANDIAIVEIHQAQRDILMRGQAHDELGKQIKPKGSIDAMGHFAGFEHEPPTPGRVGSSRDGSPTAASPKSNSSSSPVFASSSSPKAVTTPKR